MEVADQPAELEDSSMIDRLAKGDPSALDELYHRHGPVLRGVIMKILHDASETDDVLQEVLLQVWDHMDRYSPKKGRFLNWVLTVARRRAIDRVRQACAYRRATDRYEAATRRPDGEWSGVCFVETEAQQADVRALIDRQLDVLPDNQRKVIFLAYFEGRSQREIAALTRTPLGTVKTRIELGLRKLSHSMVASRMKIL